MHRLDILLLDGLHRHEAHARSTHRLADRFGIVGVVLIALHIRLHELRCDQLHAITTRLQLTRPIVRGADARWPLTLYPLDSGCQRRTDAIGTAYNTAADRLQMSPSSAMQPKAAVTVRAHITAMFGHTYLSIPQAQRDLPARSGLW